jgi:hypothetical protein
VFEKHSKLKRLSGLVVGRTYQVFFRREFRVSELTIIVSLLIPSVTGVRTLSNSLLG